ncbi:MAG TPA: glycoside hydrolase family 3 N-terminal domain-containing protein, partial [Bacteroidales bacterium]|nr:glycoside hydrolase family 3 N-terminal domain-containing protein [Bacteroidales bacterium]
MRKFFRILLYFFLSALVVIVLIVAVIYLKMKVSAGNDAKIAIALAGPQVQVKTENGFLFRDLNKNGKLDIYEDKRRSTDERVSDLISQMTLEEKAGMMFVPPVSMGKDGSISEKPSLDDIFSLMIPGTSVMLFQKKINHFNIFIGTGKKQMAEWYNNLQKQAERTRLGIPVTIASDPRNQYSNNPLASAFSGDFSIWPEPLGLAAIGDSALVQKFADIARQEYLAVGIRVALHPMADLATEPRWPRISGTFGEDAGLSARLTYAYIKGFQGDSLGPNSVACMTKHFSGGGPQKEGIDPHFPIAKGQIYPGNNFKYHLIPFEAAFKAGTAEIMPYYGVPMNITNENVGFSFNREMITGLLRGRYKFNGIVCTDWGILTDTRAFGFLILKARARGMENATPEERMLKALDAGVDQFGGEMVPEMLVTLVNDKKVSESRIDSSVRRILRVKFRQGLFDDPFVNVLHAVETVGKDEYKKAGLDAQRKSIVLVKNDSTLPLKKGLRIYVENMNPAALARYGATSVEKISDADMAIIRIKAPGQVLEGMGLLGRMFNSGDLDFKGKEKT